MRRTYRDWIAWTLLAGIAVIAGAEYYAQSQSGVSTGEYVYRIVVTPDHPSD